MTLLEKAKTSLKNQARIASLNITNEHKALIKAYIVGEIRIGDVSMAIGGTTNASSPAYVTVARACRIMWESGELTIKLK